MTDVERFYTPGCTDKVVLARHYDGLEAELAAWKINYQTLLDDAIQTRTRIAQLEERLEAAHRAMALLQTECQRWQQNCTGRHGSQMPCVTSETMGEHPGGGPCIHVWALTNRSAVENGKCELCGNTVKIGSKP